MSNHDDLDGDWLGRMMEQSNAKAKAPLRPKVALTPTALPNGVVTQQPAYLPPQTDNYEAFMGLYFLLDGISRECYYAFRQGARDVYWLRASQADHQPGFVFDGPTLDRQGLLLKVKAGEDLVGFGNLNTKPR